MVDGALDALDRITAAVVRFGDHVLVENPAFPPMLDLLETVGATVVGVPLDASRAAARRARRRAGRVPAGGAVPAAPGAQPDRRQHDRRPRAAELAAVLAGIPDVTVVEDDHAGDIASAPPVSLGHAPAGPDRARVQLLQEPRPRPAAGRGRRAGRADRRGGRPAAARPGLVAAGCCRPSCSTCSPTRPRSPQVAAARDEYARRRAALLAALAARGVTRHRRRRHQPVDAGRRPAVRHADPGRARHRGRARRAVPGVARSAATTSG